MKINVVNSNPQIFGANVNIASVSKKAKYYMNLDEKLHQINSSSKTSIMAQVKDYADKHGIENVNIALQSVANKIKSNEHGDLLTINSGRKVTTMRFDNTTSDSELSATILGNIRENYNLDHSQGLYPMSLINAI